MFTLNVLVYFLVFAAYFGIIAKPLRNLFIYLTTKISMDWRYRREKVVPVGAREAMSHNLKEATGGVVFVTLIGLFTGAVTLLWSFSTPMMDLTHALSVTIYFAIYILIITSIYTVVEHLIVSNMGLEGKE